MTEAAQRQARAERTWWRAHRDAKHLFSDELRAARGILAHGPKHEIYGHFDGVPVRRLLLERRDATSITWCSRVRSWSASWRCGAG